MFLLLARAKIAVKTFFSRSHTISSIYIYILAVGITPYGKRDVSSTRPSFVAIFSAAGRQCQRQYFLYWCQITRTHGSTRKTPKRISLLIAPSHKLVTLKDVQVLGPRLLFNIDTSATMQPLAYRPMPASNGALRSIQHEHSNAVELQNTEFQESLYRMQTHRGLHFRGILGICYMLYSCCSKCTGLNLSLLSGQIYRRNSVWFGRDHVFLTACCVASVVLDLVQLLRKRQIIQENNKETRKNLRSSSMAGTAP